MLWFGVDDANMAVFTPVYCCATKAPVVTHVWTELIISLSHGIRLSGFSIGVSNMVYPVTV